MCCTLFLHPNNAEMLFGFLKRRLAYSIMVVRQILVLFVLVRIQVGQHKKAETFCFSFFIAHIIADSVSTDSLHEYIR